MLDLIIIGGGPAGMSAAIYAVRQKADFVLVTTEFGGQMAKKEVAIENYPGLGEISASDLIAKFRAHLEKLGVTVMIGKAVGIQKTAAGFEIDLGKEKMEARAVIVATGSEPRQLDIPGEKEFIGRGVGYCATCDGPLFTRRAVAVVGGGNAAFEAAVFLAKFAKKIYILERGPRVLADARNQELAKKTGKIEIITEAKVLRVVGDNFVKQLVYGDSSGLEIALPVEGIFVKSGNRPASGFAADLAELNEKKEIKFDCATYLTKTPGLFVAGDVSEIKYKQIIVAAGEGAKAAMAAGEYLTKMSNNK
jgi:NADH-dependent peroxiredoxin subunit F